MLPLSRLLSSIHRAGLNRLCGSTNYIQYEVALREHGDVTALELMSGGFHALGKKTFQVRVDGAVVLADDVPARLRLPCGAFKLLIEKVCVLHAVA